MRRWRGMLMLLLFVCIVGVLIAQGPTPVPDVHAPIGIWVGPLASENPPAMKQLVLNTARPTEADGIAWFAQNVDNQLWAFNVSPHTIGWLGPAHGQGGINLDGLSSDGNEAVVLFGTNFGPPNGRPIIEIKAAKVHVGSGFPGTPHADDLIFQIGNYVHLSQNLPMFQLYGDGRAFIRTNGYLRPIATGLDITALEARIAVLEAK